MDDLITTYFSTKYSVEAQTLFYRALGLFTVSNYTTPFGDIVDVVSQSGTLDETAISDSIRETIETGIDRLLSENRVSVHGETTFEERIVLCEGLFMLTKLEEPNEYLPLFDGWLTNEEIFAKTIAKALDIPFEPLMTQIAWVYEGTIQRLKDYLLTLKKDYETMDTQLVKVVRTNIITFFEVFGSIPVIENLAELNLIKGQPFTSYISLLENEIISEEEMEQNVYCLLWLALISSDGYEDPKLLLVDQGKLIFTDPTQYALFDSMLNKALASYLPARGVKK